MNRRELLGVVGFGWLSSLLGVKHERQMEDDGWRSADGLPEMLWMSPSGILGLPIRYQSLNVLCENVARVFYGHACLTDLGVFWYKESDYEHAHLMLVDRWKPIDADPKKLHSGFWLSAEKGKVNTRLCTDEEFWEQRKDDYAKGHFPKMKITKPA